MTGHADTVASDVLASFRAVVNGPIAERAASCDQRQVFDDDLLDLIASSGALGAVVQPRYGGHGLDATTFGDLCRVAGARCGATRSLLTVHSMVAHAVQRWGTEEQRSSYLPRLASGAAIGALAATELGAGTDLAAVECRVQTDGSGRHVVSGQKRWITFGQRADLFLVLATSAEGLVALVVEAGAGGVRTEPTSGQLGLRGAMIADVVMEEAPVAAIIGRPGFGLSVVFASALDLGRYTVAWGAAGMAEACVDASVEHTKSRRQFGRPLWDHDVVRANIGALEASTAAIVAVCRCAATARDSGDPSAQALTTVAKYVATRDIVDIASRAVQLHGSAGCAGGHVVERQYRDAKIMQIIEGPNEVHELAIAALAGRGVLRAP